MASCPHCEASFDESMIAWMRQPGTYTSGTVICEACKHSIDVGALLQQDNIDARTTYHQRKWIWYVFGAVLAAILGMGIELGPASDSYESLRPEWQQSNPDKPFPGWGPCYGIVGATIGIVLGVLGAWGACAFHEEHGMIAVAISAGLALGATLGATLGAIFGGILMMTVMMFVGAFFGVFFGALVLLPILASAEWFIENFQWRKQRSN